MRDFIRQYGFIIVFAIFCFAVGWWIGGQFVRDILARILAR
jgi:hypothetical protein